jgi:peptidoglycan/LPS O-acetylase OafA/YrhL
MKYRPEIDGLRTVAVMPVIFFHAGLDLFSGGFVGVDVFFVISGYLITSILIDDLQKGTFSIARFYERRARRILPALFFVMLCCAPFAWAWMLPSQMEDFGRSMIAVVFFASNILFWQNIDYFAPAAEDNPLLHTWSLAVEEQFYIFFPLLLLWLWRFGRNPAFYAVLWICVVSLLLAELGSRTAPGATFYLLHARAWELGAGSLCAFVLHRRGPLANGYLAAAGLLAVLMAATLYDKTLPFPSLYALLPVVGTALIILYAGPSTAVGKLLSLRGMVAIGLISYSAYLWHQPLFAFARIRSLTTPSEPLMIGLIILSLGLAYLSWRFVEAPFRRKARTWLPARRHVFAASLLASLAFCIAGGIVVSLKGAVLRADAEEMRGFDDRIAINPGLHIDCTADFTLSEKCRTSDAPEILLCGDSFAMHLAQGLLASDPEMKLQQHTKSQCAPILGVALNPSAFGYGEQWARDCIAFNDQVLDWLNVNDSVTHVVLSSPFSIIFYEMFDRQGDVLPQSTDHVLEVLLNTVRKIKETGAKVVIFSPTPGSGYDTGACATRGMRFGLDEGRCDFLPRNVDTLVFEFLDSLTDDAKIINLTEMICGTNLCDTIQDGNLIFRDWHHLSKEGSAYLGAKWDWADFLR